jgi:hypothetical protein
VGYHFAESEFRSLFEKNTIDRVLLPPLLIYPNIVTTNNAVPITSNNFEHIENKYHTVMKDLKIPYASYNLDDIKLIPEVAADLAGDKEPNLEMYTRAVLNAYLKQES